MLMRRVFYWLLFIMLFRSIYIHAEPSPISVVYQDVTAPYRVIMEEMYQGITEELGKPPDYFIVPSSTEQPAGIETWLSHQTRKLVIALGQRSFKAVYQAKSPLPLVIGAVLSVPPESLSMEPKPVVVSYTPAPRVFFEKLRTLTPAVKRVFLVADTAQEEWFGKEAEQSASDVGLELTLYAAQDLKTSARVYKEILETITPTDAIWITHNPQIVDDDIVLPEILKEAWSKNLVVFSSRLAHVDKGVLFVLYPDNFRLGRRLARIAQELLNNRFRGNFLQSLEDVRIAVNLRTANHLGLAFGSKQQRGFDLIFPKSQR